MALKLAIVLRNDHTGRVDRILIEQALEPFVLNYLTDLDLKAPLFGRGKDRTAAVREAVAEALKAAEMDIRDSTVRLT